MTQTETSDKAEEQSGNRYQPLRALAQWSSAAGGVVIASQGLRRRGGLGTIATIGGAALAAWGAASALTGPDLIRRHLIRRSGRTLLRAMPQGTAEIKYAVTIGRPREVLYAFWRDFTNLAQLMPDILEIRPAGERRWHWTVRGPGGVTVEWNAELVDQRKDELLAWHSVDNADIAHEGNVRFLPAPGGRGTEIHVMLTLRAPAGRTGRAVAWLFGEEPGKQLRDGLRRLKQKAETGEVPTITPQPAGRQNRKDAIP
jgi:uncharacterized membrane protein